MSTPVASQGKPELTKKDFESDQAVRWCPGCGDYSILAQTQKAMPDLGVPKENIVFISGIGCSSRFPYYMNTYGIHSIHGRAPTLATGLKIANPDLKVFVITGDGDGLSIGGNHLIHLCRRNVDVTVILFNNRIYGLTKGQYSPTSVYGQKSKSTPMGSVEQPFNPISIATAAGATFIARTVDTQTKHLVEMIERAANHKGTAFIEVLQNCPIFNDGTWEHVRDGKNKTLNSLFLEHGKPMVWGKDGERALAFNGREYVEIDFAHSPDAEPAIHSEQEPDPTSTFRLAQMLYPDFPVLLGVFRQLSAPVYEESLVAQVQQAQSKTKADLSALYNAADTWEV